MDVLYVNIKLPFITAHHILLSTVKSGLLRWQKFWPWWRLASSEWFLYSSFALGTNALLHVGVRLAYHSLLRAFLLFSYTRWCNLQHSSLWWLIYLEFYYASCVYCTFCLLMGIQYTYSSYSAWQYCNVRVPVISNHLRDFAYTFVAVFCFAQEFFDSWWAWTVSWVFVHMNFIFLTSFMSVPVCE